MQRFTQGPNDEIAAYPEKVVEVIEIYWRKIDVAIEICKENNCGYKGYAGNISEVPDIYWGIIGDATEIYYYYLNYLFGLSFIYMHTIFLHY